MHLPAGVCVMSETTFLSATTAGFGAASGSGQERSPMRAVQIFVRVVALHGGDRQRTILSYLLLKPHDREDAKVPGAEAT